MTRKPLSSDTNTNTSDRHQASSTRTSPLLRASIGRKRGSSDVPDESQRQLCPQQRYVKRPKFPGMVTFDGGLRQLPIHGSGGGRKSDIPDTTTTATMNPENTEVTEGSETAEEDGSSSESSVSVSDGTALDRHQTNSEFTIDEMNLAFLLPDSSTFHDHFSNSAAAVAAQGDTSPNCPKLKLIQTSAQHLRLEAMVIYTDLIRANVGKGQPITALPESASARKQSTWKALHGLRYALLPQSHDFMWASQSTEAPPHLKRLAARYGTTLRTTKSDIDGFMAPLYEVDPMYWTEMLGLIDKSRLLLERFETTFPSSGRDMKLANENLHQYLHALKSSGLHVAPCCYQCQSYSESERWIRWKAFKVSSTPNSLNDDLREWYLREYLTLEPLVDADEIEASYLAAGLPLEDPMLCLLSGWLAFGPVIANTFHEFCKVFKFLAWVGPTN